MRFVNQYWKRIMTKARTCLVGIVAAAALVTWVAVPSAHAQQYYAWGYPGVVAYPAVRSYVFPSYPPYLAVQPAYPYAYYYGGGVAIGSPYYYW
jgi:hypothetical protein